MMFPMKESFPLDYFFFTHRFRWSFPHGFVFSL